MTSETICASCFLTKPCAEEWPDEVPRPEGVGEGLLCADCAESMRRFVVIKDGPELASAVKFDTLIGADRGFWYTDAFANVWGWEDEVGEWCVSSRDLNTESLNWIHGISAEWMAQCSPFTRVGGRAGSAAPDGYATVFSDFGSGMTDG